MECDKPHLLPKSNSFSLSRDEKRHREFDRNLSLGPIRLHPAYENKEKGGNNGQVIQEEEPEPEPEPEPNLVTVSPAIDKFLDDLLAVGDDPEQSPELPEIPESTVEKFVSLVQEEIARYEIGEERWPTGADEVSLFDAIVRLSKLEAAAAKFSSEPMYYDAMNRSGVVLHHAMCFLEDEFHLLLQDARIKSDSGGGGSNTSKPKQPFPFQRHLDPDHAVQAEPSSPESSPVEPLPPYPAETVCQMHNIADAMISTGYTTECCQVFTVARRNAFEASLPSLGFEKVSIEDVTKMSWDSLEGEIASWVRVFKHTMTTAFETERELCDAVFAGRPAIAQQLFRSLAHCAIIQLITFAEAVAMTKRPAERLFKTLDLYEALRDVAPGLETLLHDEEAGEREESSPLVNPKKEITAVRCRLGEAAVAMFCDLESSIRADNNKTPVPGGAVHPLTRYVMDYLKNACEYRGTLEKVFREHKRDDGDSGGRGDGEGDGGQSQDLFAAQLLESMAQLNSNLEAKSKLYKDLALINIFMMNNGRFVAKKVKESAEIHGLLGETWYRRKFSELQQYHKNYQRETWGRVLGCLRDEGLQARGGNVSKPVLKERFKTFNAMFEEIHKTQTAWVVSDEQLQSELRVSVSAVVVPAYRSFLGRFSQHLDPGRQTEKYIKYGAEDLEGMIDELFEGNTAATASRRRP